MTRADPVSAPTRTLQDVPHTQGCRRLARGQDGEIVYRRFVVYREAGNNTLGDLLRKYDGTVLKDRPHDDPARGRMRCLQLRAVVSIVMSAFQLDDIAA